LITQRVRLGTSSHPEILEDITDWAEGTDFGALPEELAHVPHDKSLKEKVRQVS